MNTENAMGRQPSRMRKWTLAGLGAAVAAVVGLVALNIRSEQTVDQFVQATRQEVAAAMNAPDSPLKGHIEFIHPFTTYKGATIKSIRATTVDGSNKAGKNGSNIAQLEMVATLWWEGPIQKNGWTEIKFVLDPRAGSVKEMQYLGSSALVNLDQINWTKVGAVLGYYLVSAICGD